MAPGAGDVVALAVVGLRFRQGEVRSALSLAGGGQDGRASHDDRVPIRRQRRSAVARLGRMKPESAGNGMIAGASARDAGTTSDQN